MYVILYLRELRTTPERQWTVAGCSSSSSSCCCFHVVMRATHTTIRSYHEVQIHEQASKVIIISIIFPTKHKLNAQYNRRIH